MTTTSLALRHDMAGNSNPALPEVRMAEYAPWSFGAACEDSGELIEKTLLQAAVGRDERMAQTEPDAGRYGRADRAAGPNATARGRERIEELQSARDARHRPASWKRFGPVRILLSRRYRAASRTDLAQHAPSPSAKNGGQNTHPLRPGVLSRQQRRRKNLPGSIRLSITWAGAPSKVECPSATSVRMNCIRWFGICTAWVRPGHQDNAISFDCDFYRQSCTRILPHSTTKPWPNITKATVAPNPGSASAAALVGPNLCDDPEGDSPGLRPRRIRRPLLA